MVLSTAVPSASDPELAKLLASNLCQEFLAGLEPSGCKLECTLKKPSGEFSSVQVGEALAFLVFQEQKKGHENAGEGSGEITAERKAAIAKSFGLFIEQHLELARLKETVRDSERSKSAFLATISHELRTPLTSIIGYSEMLRDGFGGSITSAQKEFVETILGKGRELLAQISDVLDATAMESEGVVVRKTSASITTLVKSTIGSLPTQVQSSIVVLEEETTEYPAALIDIPKIRQAMTHILVNATKFSPNGKKVEVSFATGPIRRIGSEAHNEEAITGRGPDGVERRGNMPGVLVRVRDFGIGMDKTIEERIFDPFFQGDSSTTREFGGLGLGLSLAKLYIEAHGGSIWVESSLGEGSSFTVGLPLNQEAEPESPTTTSQADELPKVKKGNS